MSQQFPMSNPTWDLDTIFEGGVESEEFRQEVERLDGLIAELHGELDVLPSPSQVTDDDGVLAKWDDFIARYFDVRDRLSEALSFARSLASAHADSPKAARMPSLLDDGRTAILSLAVDLKDRFRGMGDASMEVFLADSRFESRKLWLEELRRDADRSMDRELEGLAVALNRDGLHAWGRLYFEVTGRMEVDVQAEEEPLSIAQAKNLMSDADRSRRKAAHLGLQDAWEEVAPVCASIAHSLRGAERTLFERRGGDYLTEPLFANRVQRDSIEAMLEAAREFRPVLQRYLNAKAKHLGLEKLEWFDLKAPVGGGEDAHIGYEEAQRFIVDQAEGLSSKIADFCRMALSRRWVEAEDRSGKRQGGYCTSLPVSKEFRIFMTFGNTSASMTTLAHELGHGYHAHVMKDMERSETRVPMGLGESASTLLEAIVEKAALEEADEKTRLSLLDDRLGRAVAFLMNIPARFELEEAMHEKRKKTTLHDEMLSEMTTQIFQEHYGQGLASVDQYLWASTLHFYLTHLQFYNFPYTFGYLFSRAVYDRCRAAAGSFEDSLDDLLRDTGRMNCEDLAAKHLDADLGDPTFWIDAAGNIEDDVERFERLAKSAS